MTRSGVVVSSGHIPQETPAAVTTSFGNLGVRATINVHAALSFFVSFISTHVRLAPRFAAVMPMSELPSYYDLMRWKN